MRDFLIVLLVGTLGACALAPPPVERTASANQLAAAQGWQQLTLSAPPFALAAFAPALEQTDTLTVYLEGDGLAWLSPDQPSPDPTPLDPVALKLALAWPHHAAYLARPCQYITTATCADHRWWSDHRFAPAIIATTNSALDQLKSRAQARQLILVGYSGGGVLAALVATQRHDVTKLITVASPLDTAAWTKLHNVDPLTGSQNPADLAATLATIPQRHFSGTDDKTVPPAIAQSYAARFPANAQPTLNTVPGFDHHCCWADRWPALAVQSGLD